MKFLPRRSDYVIPTFDSLIIENAYSVWDEIV